MIAASYTEYIFGSDTSDTRTCIVTENSKYLNAHAVIVISSILDIQTKNTITNHRKYAKPIKSTPRILWGVFLSGFVTQCRHIRHKMIDETRLFRP